MPVHRDEPLEAGIGQYWLVDPALRTLEVLTNLAKAWELAGVIVPLDLRLLPRT